MTIVAWALASLIMLFLVVIVDTYQESCLNKKKKLADEKAFSSGDTYFVIINRFSLRSYFPFGFTYEIVDKQWLTEKDNLQEVVYQTREYN